MVDGIMDFIDGYNVNPEFKCILKDEIGHELSKKPLSELSTSYLSDNVLLSYKGASSGIPNFFVTENPKGFIPLNFFENPEKCQGFLKSITQRGYGLSTTSLNVRSIDNFIHNLSKNTKNPAYFGKEVKLTNVDNLTELFYDNPIKDEIKYNRHTVMDDEHNVGYHGLFFLIPHDLRGGLNKLINRYSTPLNYDLERINF